MFVELITNEVIATRGLLMKPVHTLLKLKQLVIFFQNAIVFSNIVQYKCNISAWN